MKFIKRIAATAMALVASCNLFLTASAYPYIYSHSASFEQQVKSKWCWAACSLMSGREEYATTMNQYQVAYHVKGNYNNETATMSETVDAAEYVTNYTKTYSYSNSAKPKEFFISQFLANHSPIVSTETIASNGNVSDIKHLVMPYRIVIGSSTATVIYWYDPAGGVTRSADFGEFCSGEAILYGTKKVKYIGTINT